MNIDYDKTKARFVIRCPIWANDVVNTLPSRKWNKPLRAWVAPLIRHNVPLIESMTKMGGVTTTPAAVAALKTYEEKEAQVRTGRGAGFPSWYAFKREPRKHQRRAIDKGYGVNYFALFMEMQTGKSKTLIDLVSAHRMEGHLQGGVIFTKRTLRRNWVKYFNLDCPIPHSVFMPDTGKPKLFDKWMEEKHDFKVMLVGWESLSQGGMHGMVKTFMKSMLHSFCGGDETTFITNHKSLRSKEAVEIAHMADYRYALTGSPALEGPMNLYMQFEFLDPDIIGIGDFFAYRNRYAIMGGFQREVRPGLKVPTEIIGYQNLDELMKTVAPYTFQVVKTEAYDLPPKRFKTYEIEMTKEQRRLYDLVKKDGTLNLKGHPEQVMKNVLEVSLRLHQIVGGYAVKGREVIKRKKDGTEALKMEYDSVELLPPAKNPKMLEVVNVIEEWKKKKQGVLWVVYMPEIIGLMSLLRKMGLRIGQLHGGIPDVDRQPMVDEFNAGGLDLIVGNASTGSMGFPMPAATVNMFYNNTFKAIDRVQAEDRSWGDGQTKQGIWMDFAAEKTIDYTILAALEQKQDLAAFVRTRIGEITRLLDGDV